MKASSRQKADLPEILLKRVAIFIQSQALIPQGERLLVGVSGGPDSVCLVHLLHRLREKLGVELFLAHLNHGLRGADSEEDARYVQRLAHSLGLPVIVESCNVLALQAERKISLEEAAREARYGFFARAARSLGAKRVAVGHTADDQVETLLLHLVRGTGLEGLGGMQSLSPWQLREGEEPLLVVRPLLEVSREETEAYCQSYALEPRQDLSNRSSAFLRNRLRQEAVPLLQSFNPNIKQTLLRSAQALREDYAFIQEKVAELWKKVVKKEGEGWTVDKDKLSRQHPALQRHLLRKVLEGYLGSPRDIEAQHIERMVKALSMPAGKRVSLLKGTALWVDYDRLLLGAPPPYPFPPLEGEYRLKVPGETRLPGWKVIATPISSGKKLPSQSLKAFFDSVRAGPELVVRQRREGDRFQPLGMSQPQKLQDFMVNSRIPRSWRNRVPLVCSGEDILWVVGWRVGEKAKLTPTTKQVLSLEFKQG